MRETSMRAGIPSRVLEHHSAPGGAGGGEHGPLGVVEIEDPVEPAPGQEKHDRGRPHGRPG
jgi:hypothetical protein